MDNILVVAWILPGFIFTWLVGNEKSGFYTKKEFAFVPLSVTLAIPIIFVGRFWIAILNQVICSETIILFRTIWHKIIPVPHSFSFLFCCALAIVASRIFRNWQHLTSNENENSKLFQKLYELISSKSPVLLTLKSGKFYIGMITDVEVDEIKENNFIEIVPLFSGKESQKGKVILTRYVDEENKPIRASNGKFIRTTIMFSEVARFSEFHKHLFENHFKNKL